MLKKLLEFTGDPQTVMTVVTVCTLAISIIALIVDEPSPGVAYVMGEIRQEVPIETTA